MIGTLLKLRLRSALGTITSGNKKNGKERISRGRVILIALLYLYLVVVFGGLFTTLAFSMAPVLISAGLDWFYFSAFMIMAFAVVFIFSIFETKSELFECKDNELLLSMPIKPHDIVLSRMFTVLVYNYLETALVLLPAIAVYAGFGGSIKGIAGSVIMLLLLPLLATSLAAGVGYLVALISRRLKNNTFITTAISLVFLLLYFWGYGTFLGSGEEEVDFIALSKSFTGLRFVGEAAVCHPLFLSLFVLLTLGVSAAAYLIISRSYIKIVTAKDGAKKKKYKDTYLKKSPIMAALIKKELRLFSSSATYMLNAGLGMVFTVVVGVVVLVNKETIPELLAALTDVGTDREVLLRIFAALISAALIFVGSTNTISASALSLEGKRLWITKTLPISARQILIAKTAPAAILPILPNLFASVCFIIALLPDPFTSLLMLLIPVTASLMSALLGTVLNAAFPKFEYQNDAQAVKQSLSVFLSMLITTLYGMGCIVLAFVFSLVLLMPTLAMLLILLLNIAVSVALSFFIAGPLARKIENISV